MLLNFNIVYRCHSWIMIQEAVRQGSVETIKLLLEHGADMNMRTKGVEAGASGGTPLWWANEFHNPAHPAVILLERYGAINIAPRGTHA